jgi:hypothetical protein
MANFRGVPRSQIPKGDAWVQVFGKDFPLITPVEISRLWSRDWMVEISGIAAIEWKYLLGGATAGLGAPGELVTQS